MFEVTATQSSEISVDINDSEIKRIVITKFNEIFNLSDSVYIKDGLLMETVKEWDGSRLSINENMIREATEEDYMAVLILGKLFREL